MRLNERAGGEIPPARFSLRSADGGYVPLFAIHSA